MSNTLQPKSLSLHVENQNNCVKCRQSKDSVKNTMNHHYHTKAESVRFKDITSSAKNRTVLYRIKINDPSFTSLSIEDTDAGNFGEEDVFIVGEGDDLEWLGYFIGENKTLTRISFCYLPACKDQLELLFSGIKRNKSIQSAGIYFHGNTASEYFSAINLPQVTDIEICGYDADTPYIATALHRCTLLTEYDGPVTSEISDALAMLPMLEKVRTQMDRPLDMPDIPISLDECLAMRRLLAIANNIKEVVICNVGLGNDGLELLAEGLAYNASLTDGVLDLSGNAIGDQGLQALASSLALNSKLRTLHLTDNNIGDAGLEALADSLSNNGSLRELSLSGNASISEVGVAAISGTLAAPTCSLEDLRLWRVNISVGGLRVLAHALSQNKSLKSLSVGDVGDEGACALANALCQNTSLKSLTFNAERVTSEGWNAFLKLLCDTSTPHSTHLSNHTLGNLSLPNVGTSVVQENIRNLLRVNRDHQSPLLAAKLKILAFFPNIDMSPFFKWSLKYLPFVKNWFDTVTSSNESAAACIETRNLSAVYQFVRGMSFLVVDECKKNEESKKAKKATLSTQMEGAEATASKDAGRVEFNATVAAAATTMENLDNPDPVEVAEQLEVNTTVPVPATVKKETVVHSDEGEKGKGINGVPPLSGGADEDGFSKPSKNQNVEASFVGEVAKASSKDAGTVGANAAVAATTKMVENLDNPDPVEVADVATALKDAAEVNTVKQETVVHPDEGEKGKGINAVPPLSGGADEDGVIKPSNNQKVAVNDCVDADDEASGCFPKAKASSENEKKTNDDVAILKADVLKVKKENAILKADLLKVKKENAILKDNDAKLEDKVAMLELLGLVMAFSVFPWTRVFLFIFSLVVSLQSVRA